MASILFAFGNGPASGFTNLAHGPRIEPAAFHFRVMTSRISPEIAFFPPPAAPPFRQIASAPASSVKHLFRRHLPSSETFLCLDWAAPWTEPKAAGKKLLARIFFRCQPRTAAAAASRQVARQIIPAILPQVRSSAPPWPSNMPPCPAWEKRLAMEFGARRIGREAAQAGSANPGLHFPWWRRAYLGEVSMRRPASPRRVTSLVQRIAPERATIGSLSPTQSPLKGQCRDQGRKKCRRILCSA